MQRRHWFVRVLVYIFCFAWWPRKARPMCEGDASKFLADISLPDGTKVKPGEMLVKEWAIQNAGTVTWTGRFLVPVSSTLGEKDLKRIEKVKVPDTKPGQKCLLKVPFKAPPTSGEYKVEFKMVDDKGNLFFPNQNPVFFLIVVEE